MQKQKELMKKICSTKEELKALDDCYNDITTVENQLLEVRKNLLEKVGELDTYVPQTPADAPE